MRSFCEDGNDDDVGGIRNDDVGGKALVVASSRKGGGLAM